MLRILATLFAALFGLAFGSFLNVCVSRWPRGESVARPRSRCMHCGRTLAWWENVPLLSWLVLRGRCRTCREPIGLRYPIVEAAVAGLWATLVWYSNADVFAPDMDGEMRALNIVATLGGLVFLWLLVALAAVDAEQFWLPDFLTWPGILAGIVLKVAFGQFGYHTGPRPWQALLDAVVASAAAGLVILLVRWTYWLIRRREGLGLGDAKLMAMIAAWLGLQLAMLSLFLGVVLGAAMAVFVLLKKRQGASAWAAAKLPLGTFLSIGAMISALWGQQIMNAYLAWAGFR